jgi:hypothetical protein
MKRKSWLQTIASIILILTVCFGILAQGRRPGKGQPPPGSDGFYPGTRRERQPGDRPDFRGGPPRTEGQRPAPPESSFRFLSSEMRFNHKVVKSAPYSAIAEMESVQPLMDGSKITRKTTAQLYRDSEGRTRREQKLNYIGGFATSEDTPPMVFIDDPVAGVSYMLDSRQLSARKMPFRGAPPAGGPPPMRREGTSEAKTESLGKQMIEGVEAEGTRSTITIPAGQIGNENPLEIVSERWYAPALQEVILSKHRDPRQGEYTYRLTNINRSEPTPTLFQPPADYAITEDQRGPGGPKRRHEDE